MKRMHKAGLTTVQDLIASVLNIHPEYIKVTDKPISMMFKYSENDSATIIVTSEDDVFDDDLWSMLPEDIIDGKSGGILKDSDILFCLIEDENGFKTINKILVYKKAHMCKIKREFDKEIARIKELNKYLDEDSIKEKEDNIIKELNEMGIPSEYITILDFPGGIEIEVTKKNSNFFYVNTDFKAVDKEGKILEDDNVIVKISPNAKNKPSIEEIFINRYCSMDIVKKFITKVLKILENNEKNSSKG